MAARLRPNRNRTTVLLLGAVIVGMVGLSAAAVPLYRLFCQATGYGGTTQRAQAAPGGSRRRCNGALRRRDRQRSRLGIPPVEREVQVQPGEQREVFFRAVNRSREAVTAPRPTT